MFTVIIEFKKFPSPYGVIFILTWQGHWKLNKNPNLSGFRLPTELYSFLLEYHMTMKDTMNEEFPSPYGVSFILIDVLI